MFLMINLYKLFLFLFIFTACLQSYSQDVQLSLAISNTFNNPVPDATISINQKKYKADSLGKAVIPVTGGRYSIYISSVNHFPYTATLNAAADTSINIVMRF